MRFCWKWNFLNDVLVYKWRKRRLLEKSLEKENWSLVKSSVGRSYRRRIRFGFHRTWQGGISSFCSWLEKQSNACFRQYTLPLPLVFLPYGLTYQSWVPGDEEVSVSKHTITLLRDNKHTLYSRSLSTQSRLAFEKACERVGPAMLFSLQCRPFFHWIPRRPSSGVNRRWAGVAYLNPDTSCQIFPSLEQGTMYAVYIEAN